MGYEVKVIIGTCSNVVEVNHSKYFNIIAQYDLCKVNLDIPGVNHQKGAKLLDAFGVIELIPIYCYLDGNTRVNEDCYGTELIAFDPKLLLNELKEKKIKTDNYRRYPPLIALLESMLSVWGEDFQVVLYGH